MDKYSRNGKILITVLGGWFGLHHYLNKNYKMGVLYTFTFGCFYIGWIIDIVKVLKDKTTSEDVQMKEETPIKNEVNNNSINDNVTINNEVPVIDLSAEYQKVKTLDMPKDYVTIDVETTGLDFNNDRIIEISAIKYINNSEVDSFSYLVNPNMKLSETIIRITGITNEDLIDKTTIDEVLPKFIHFIEDYTLVAHNASYDFKMITAECNRCHLEVIKNKIADTLVFAKRYYSKKEVENYKLETFKKYFNLDYQSHRALADCYTCAYLYQQCLEKYKESMPQLNDDEVKALEIVKGILQKNNLDTSALRGFLLSFNVLSISIFHSIFKIKCRGKLKYILFDSNITEESYDFSNFELAAPSKSENSNFRILYNDVNELYELEKIIVDEYLKTKNSVDYYISDVSSGKRNFDDYLLTGYKI